MTRWYPLEPADAGFVETAPQVLRFELRVAVSPARVWESLASHRSIAAWGPMVSSLRWTTPVGADARREVALLRAVRVREQFFRWDEGRGYSFYGSAMTIPVLRRFAEDYVVEPAGDGALLTWRVALEPKPAFALPNRLLGPLNRLAFARMAADGRRYFERAPHADGNAA